MMDSANVLRCRCCLLWRTYNGVGHSTSRHKHGKARSNLPNKNHYEVLGLKPDASRTHIRAAFVNLSKQIHPDKNPGDPHNHDKFVQLNEAYTILSRPVSRREYDVSLAYRLHRRQDMARNAYGTHTAGENHHPGSGTARGQSDDFSERVFWDETIWYMRDRSKDAGGGSENYYGIRGVRRVPNSYILAGCMVLMVIGTASFVMAWRWSSLKRQETLDLIDKKNLALLEAARSRARALGTARQLELMTATWNSNKKAGAPPPSE